MSLVRVDRLATLCFFYPLLRIGPQNRERRIPILMYHSISENADKKCHPYFQTTTTPEVFAAHMKYLHDYKYSVINLQDILKYFENKRNISDKPVVITFDDGFRDFCSNAFPVLQKYGFSSTVFLPTGFIGKEPSEFKGKKCLLWQEVRNLRKKGIIFGSHTVNHLKLNMLKSDELEFELMRSKEQIEDEIGEPVESFSYPFAFPQGDKEFIANLRGILERYGYKYGVNTRIGTSGRNDDFLFLKRIPVNALDDPLFFKAKLIGAYNWMKVPQLVFNFHKSKS